MPIYKYQCSASGQVVEVSHSIMRSIATWGELCEFAGTDPGDIDASAPVRRLIAGGLIITRSSREARGGTCCGRSSCGEHQN